MATRIAILGGSNSLLKSGWVDCLTARYAEGVDVQNLSIGASTSAMGIFRYLSALDRSDDRILVWEYSLNEENYFRRGQSLQSILFHAEWILHLCAREKRKLLAVLLYNRREEEKGILSAYRDALRTLFERYSIEVVDAQELLYAIAGTDKPDLDFWYKESAHYSVETSFMPILAEAVFHGLAVARCPAVAATDHERFDGRDLALCYPSGDKGVPFRNRILTCTRYPIIDDVIIPAQGKLLACILVTSNNAEAALVIADDRQKGPYSTQVPGGPSAPKFLLKHIILWDSFDDMLTARHEVKIVDARRALGLKRMGKPIRQSTFCWDGAKDAVREDSVVAVIVETGHDASPETFAITTAQNRLGP
ncbi:hypothetical protein MRS76_09055 [Rhizobiaceae bacterium n13]|uniref:Uncharacterized protein n=1 Tax=Ferirhizobium litorale TaxID=2927786 RepID=A0AAE3QGC6_9HYPH|nr:hypothetical protein [Fererhizobium litorale]MDI7862104.1 hypothetical protein [Fererhizobium litorale]MDI7922623.1 hypothetical protein [Fererhizobium litorale]